MSKKLADCDRPWSSELRSARLSGKAGRRILVNKFDKRGRIIPWKVGFAKDSNQPISSSECIDVPMRVGWVMFVSEGG